MDIDALSSALLSLTLLPEQILRARANVSRRAGRNSSDFTVVLAGLERDLRIAKAALASELGFAICACCWPPEIFATDKSGRAFCPRSGDGRLRRGPGSRLTGASIRPKPRRVDRFTRTQKEKLLQMRDHLTRSIRGEAKGRGLLAQGSGDLFEIEQALQRIDHGTYGICEGSGEPIPRERLEVSPVARHTVGYEARLERERKARFNQRTESSPVELDHFFADDRSCHIGAI